MESRGAVPEEYVFPADQRPGDSIVLPPSHKIPVIDMANHHPLVVQHIMQASQHFGAFQVINHGVDERLMDEARSVFKEFFELPPEEKAKFQPGKADPRCILCKSNIDYDKEQLHFWREVFKQRCAPLEECLPLWPHKPTRYREVVAEFIEKVKELGARLRDIMCEGLGIEHGSFGDELSKDLDLLVNHYPICPDPSLTLGIARHSDRSLMTILVQDHVSGLQIFKDGDWYAVDPTPGALVVTLGYIFQIVSNGKIKNGDHRVVTSSKEARHSGALFICPTQDCIIEPVKALVNEENPAMYRPAPYHEFLRSYIAARQAKKHSEDVLKPFQIIAPSN